MNCRHVLEGASRDRSGRRRFTSVFRPKAARPRSLSRKDFAFSHGGGGVLGEIDIVARRRRLLVFVEVKARATIDDAAELVNVRQRRRIAAAAEIWLAANPDDSIRDIRFDAILVAPGKIP